MNIVFFDDDHRDHFLPLVYTRPVSELRLGILTIREKWEKRLQASNSKWLTADYLSKKYPAPKEGEYLFINGRCLPNEATVEAISLLEKGEAITQGDFLIAAFFGESEAAEINTEKAIEEFDLDILAFEGVVSYLQDLTDLFKKNGSELKLDYELLTQGRTSEQLHESNTIIGDKNQIFLEEGAEVIASIVNVTDGPIYLSKNASISEGCMVKSGLALGESAQLKMGTKIYGASTFGPHCKVGGEVNNSILMGYSNKGHDGFLGNSIIGEWCNLGADTNTSNLKNNYGEVSIWSYAEQKMVPTGGQFCGLIMGDHGKSSINTMFNTGTVAGVSANIFGGGFPPKMIPSFSWGGEGGLSEFRIEKAFEVAERMMSRRGIAFDQIEQDIMHAVFQQTQTHR